MFQGDYLNYLLPVAIVGYFFWRFIKFKKIRSHMKDYLKNGAVVIDVRSPAEFAQGHSAHSINIPLNELPQRFGEIDKSKKIILCCASGARSGMAVTLLKNNGFQDVMNAGPWVNTMGVE